MRLVVFGANGGVGRRAVQVAASQGHEVVAAARTVGALPSGVVPVVVDVGDVAAVQGVVEGADALLWCVGVTKRSGPRVGREGLPHVLAAAERFGVTRLVSVSGAGVTLPGDRKGPGARLVSALTRRLARDLVQDKEGEHELLAASSLNWTEVRPPRLIDDGGGGRWALVETAPGLTEAPVRKLDVARVMVDLSGSGDWSRRSPFLVMVR